MANKGKSFYICGKALYFLYFIKNGVFYVFQKGFFVSVLAACSVAQAAIGIVTGHYQYREDGNPDLQPGEQLSVFYCTRNSGDEGGQSTLFPNGNAVAAQDCAFAKCVRKFKSDSLCKRQGYSDHPGYVIVMISKPVRTFGKTRGIFSQSIAVPTRQLAYDYVMGTFSDSTGDYFLDAYEENGTLTYNKNHDPHFHAGKTNMATEMAAQEEDEFVIAPSVRSRILKY